MNMKMLKATVLGVVLSVSGFANAGLIQITAESAVSGELGWFIVDDFTLSTDDSLVASQFYDFRWFDPVSLISILPSDVISDTGVTYFSWTGSEWTVSGGGGDSLTTSDGGLWIAGSSFLVFSGSSLYSDVRWSTKEYTASVPEPSTLAIFALGIMGLAARRSWLVNKK